MIKLADGMSSLYMYTDRINGSAVDIGKYQLIRKLVSSIEGFYSVGNCSRRYYLSYVVLIYLSF